MEGENDNWFEEMFAADEGTPAVDEAATQAAAPEADSLPESDVPDEPLAADATPESDPEPVAADAATDEEPEPEPPTIDWNHPELQPVVQAAQQFQALRQQAEQIRQQQQAAAFQARIRELSDDDPERLGHLNQMVAQVAAPAVQQAQQAIQQRDQIGKAFSAFYVAAKANLTEEQLSALMAETDDLMTVEGGEVMEKRAFGKKESQRQYTEQLTAKEQRIKELERQIAAQGQLASREATGADLVDSGTGGVAGGGSRTDQMRTATDMDAYWAAFTGAD